MNFLSYKDPHCLQNTELIWFCSSRKGTQGEGDKWACKPPSACKENGETLPSPPSKCALPSGMGGVGAGVGGGGVGAEESSHSLRPRWGPRLLQQQSS